MPEPSIGRIVRIHNDSGDRAAIITEVKESSVLLTIFLPMYTMSGVESRYSEGKETGTWHWPEITPVMQGKG